MTTLGWIFMATSLTMVWAGTFWCFYKVLTSPQADQDAET